MLWRGLMREGWPRVGPPATVLRLVGVGSDAADGSRLQLVVLVEYGPRRRPSQRRHASRILSVESLGGWLTVVVVGRETVSGLFEHRVVEVGVVGLTGAAADREVAARHAAPPAAAARLWQLGGRHAGATAAAVVTGGLVARDAGAPLTSAAAEANYRATGN